jgi:hypothetical protein
VSTDIHGHQKVDRALEFGDPIDNFGEELAHDDDAAIATLERPVLVLSLFLLLLRSSQDVVHDSVIIIFAALEIADISLFFFAQVLFRFVPKFRAIFMSLFRSLFGVDFEAILT